MPPKEKSNPYRTNVTIKNSLLDMVDDYKETTLAQLTGMDSRSSFFETLAISFFLKLKGHDKVFSDLTTVSVEDLIKYRPQIEKMRKELAEAKVAH